MKKTSMQINLRSFLSSLAILLVLVLLTYTLSLVIPAGEFKRQVIGKDTIIVPGTYQQVEGGIAWWQLILAPFLSLASSGSSTLIAIMIFLLIIGGTFFTLEQSGLLQYVLAKISHRYRERKYLMLFIITLFFMLLGNTVGTFEEVVPLVPLAIGLACAMGWDEMVGLGMSIFACGLGFSTGMLNPFTVGVAQQLVGLPLFSGLSMRFLAFLLIFSLLMIFLYRYAKQVESQVDLNSQVKVLEFKQDQRLDRAALTFSLILALTILLVLLSSFLSFLQGILLPLIALLFLLSGLSASLISGMSYGKLVRSFFRGISSMLPAILLILLAASIRYIMVESKIMDTILNYFVTKASGLSPIGAIFLIYAIVLFLNFFIASGSAKALLLMPIITPIVDLAGISRQTSVMIFAFGDGFSNLLYPTNPVLLISLGLAAVGYARWLKFTILFQTVILLVSLGLSIFAHYIGY